MAQDYIEKLEEAIEKFEEEYGVEDLIKLSDYDDEDRFIEEYQVYFTNCGCKGPLDIIFYVIFTIEKDTGQIYAEMILEIDGEKIGYGHNNFYKVIRFVYQNGKWEKEGWEPI
jgi:hypothetical protein